MEKMAWMADYSGVHYEVSSETKRLINEERARRRALAWMTDDDGKMTAKLSIVAAAVSAAVGLEATNNFGQTVAAPEKHFPGIIPVEPVTREEFRIPVFDYQAQIVRHQASAVRLDELTRLRVRDEYQASKQASMPSAPPVVTESASDAPATQGNIMKKAALIAALEHDWQSIEADISEATRNGLKAAAHTGKHGDWDKDKAHAWAVSKGKINQTSPAHSLTGAWPGTTKRHTISR